MYLWGRETLSLVDWHNGIVSVAVSVSVAVAVAGAVSVASAVTGSSER